ncbi:hypothetical protein KCMC57_up16130 [Kitasatospora sp. CMC57]|uniref:Uncharacterized protein n=1 Tax=Kitasatospora sp. CMC57 TaxID=3231513 RepID=A0AB33JXG9_9ACTN
MIPETQPESPPHDLPEHPTLAAWLAERRAAPPSWAEEAFGGAWRWNFHPDTLDRLAAEVVRRFATAEEFDAAREEPFVQGACWYLGEVIRRTRGAVWRYLAADPGSGPAKPGSRAGLPFVDQPTKPGRRHGGPAGVPA